MEAKLPQSTEAIEIELEMTNYCNANCVACPRNQLTAPKGMMDEKTFQIIINKYDSIRNSFKINRFTESHQYPFISFAGMGEPLLNKNIFKYIKYANERKFKTMIFTNASLLSKDYANRLAEAGINDMNISFWGTTPQEYERSMGLNYDTSLKNIEYMSRVAKEHNINIIISWIRNKYVTSTVKEIVNFWSKYGLTVDLEDDNKAWNRGGLLSDSELHENFDEYPDINFDLDIWCSQLYFTDTVTWDGYLLPCSCDYYRRDTIIGNLKETPIKELRLRKQELIEAKSKIHLCQFCKKPNRNYALGSTPWDEILEQDEKEKYYYF